ncbi:hypothetical protein PNOK_0100800 [Pyrrhoderma noxium]|uniref:Uncharacterized protein n=1 Tax=Pyrrhoderma noxium TaxID=2282107 RepID=A0A286UWF7_9AGAM|nr:hypothetical protein PNOK_0100800 [Pyrrhoderma noxium]
MEHIQLSFVVEIEYHPPPKSQSMTLENYEFHFDDSPIENQNANQTDAAIPSDLTMVLFEDPPDPLTARGVQRVNNLLNNLCSGE